MYFYQGEKRLVDANNDGEVGHQMLIDNVCNYLRASYGDDYLTLVGDQQTPSFLNDEVKISLDFFNDLEDSPNYESLELNCLGDLHKSDSSASLNIYLDNLNKTNDNYSKIDWIADDHGFFNNHDNKNDLRKSKCLFHDSISYVNNPGSFSTLNKSSEVDTVFDLQQNYPCTGLFDNSEMINKSFDSNTTKFTKNIDAGFSNLYATDFSKMPYSNKTINIADVEQNRMLVLQPKDETNNNVNPEFHLFGVYDKNETSSENKSYSTSNSSSKRSQDFVTLADLNETDSNQPQRSSGDVNLFHQVEVWHPGIINFDETKVDFKHELDLSGKCSEKHLTKVSLRFPNKEVDVSLLKKLFFGHLMYNTAEGNI